MPDALVIGLDASTTAVKAIAFDLHGSIVAQAQRPLALRMPRPGWHEQDAEEWWTAGAAALREVAGQVGTGRLAGLAIAHQRETFVPVDAAGQPLGPALVWMDERARALLPALQARYGAERFHQLTGKPLSGNLSLMVSGESDGQRPPTTGHAGDQGRKGLEVGRIQQDRQQRGRLRQVGAEAHRQVKPAHKKARFVQAWVVQEAVQPLETAV